jgi:hypothetical protein
MTVVNVPAKPPSINSRKTTPPRESGLSLAPTTAIELG